MAPKISPTSLLSIKLLLVLQFPMSRAITLLYRISLLCSALNTNKLLLPIQMLNLWFPIFCSYPPLISNTEDTSFVPTNDSYEQPTVTSKVGQKIVQPPHLKDYICAKSSSTPMEPNIKLSKDDGELLTNPTSYRSFIGKLIYLTINRPDTSFAGTG